MMKRPMAVAAFAHGLEMYKKSPRKVIFVARLDPKQAICTIVIAVKFKLLPR